MPGKPLGHKADFQHLLFNRTFPHLSSLYPTSAFSVIISHNSVVSLYFDYNLHLPTGWLSFPKCLDLEVPMFPIATFFRFKMFAQIFLNTWKCFRLAYFWFPIFRWGMLSPYWHLWVVLCMWAYQLPEVLRAEPGAFPALLYPWSQRNPSLHKVLSKYPCLLRTSTGIIMWQISHQILQSPL
jgi:hypothetical protein